MFFYVILQLVSTLSMDYKLHVLFNKVQYEMFTKM